MQTTAITISLFRSTIISVYYAADAYSMLRATIFRHSWHEILEKHVQSIRLKFTWPHSLTEMSKIRMLSLFELNVDMFPSTYKNLEQQSGHDFIHGQYNMWTIVKPIRFPTSITGTQPYISKIFDRIRFVNNFWALKPSFVFLFSKCTAQTKW